MSPDYKKGWIDCFVLFTKLGLLKTFVKFHGYTVFPCGKVLNKKGEPLKKHLRERNGGKFDHRVSLYIRGKQKHFTLQRLVSASFQGPIYGYEINHKNRDTLDNPLPNLERLTPSQNQKHWRTDEKMCKLSL